MYFQAWADDVRIIICEVDASFNKNEAQAFYIEDHYLKIINKIEKNASLIYTCETDFDIDVEHEYTIYEAHHYSTILKYRFIVKSDYFSKRYKYDGKLGALYTKERTSFYLFAPTSQDACVELFRDKTSLIQMSKKDGVFSVVVEGDLRNVKYRYLTRCYGKPREFVDPYANAFSPNGEYSCVCDCSSFDQISDFENCKDPIIYELSIRDFTNDPNTSIVNKSKYLGLIEKGQTIRNTSCGIEYLKELGITHVQIMPIQQNGTVDDLNQSRYYNWSYDPVSYSVSEGSYSIEPFTPLKRIEEINKMVNELHQNNIGVIYDVVYNHIYDGVYNALNKAVPYYYYRYNDKGEMSNGSGCGNDMDTKLPMVRHLILNSVDIFIKRFKADGLRFDLMGLIDKETMRMIVDYTHSIRSDFIIYGEGWDMLTSLENNEKTTINNIDENLKLGYFNDYFRKIIQRENDREINPVDLISCFTTLPFNENYYRFIYPKQSINYIECHDGLTLFDRLNKTDFDNKDNIVKLCLSMILLSFGTPFIHSGMEFKRTKYGEENSYDLSDKINRIEYRLKDENQWLVDYTKDLISLRKELNIYNISKREIEKRVTYSISYDTDLRITVNTKGLCFYDELKFIINTRNENWNEELYSDYILLLNDLGKHHELVTSTFVNSYSLVLLGRKV